MPWLLILDEPCQGLDTLQKTTVLKAVERIVEQTKATILFVTHNPREMPLCITHILRLKDGKARIVKRG
jgi:ABC-type molybdenum transport system ATPase subunit/photorepair protein PhrA